MTKPKVTYRKGKNLSVHPSLTAMPGLDASETTLPRALQAVLLEARFHTVDQAALPNGQEVKATLERLASKASIEERRWAILEFTTQAALATAALKLEGAGDLDPATWGPARLREMAKEALEQRAWTSMCRAGRPRSAANDQRLLDSLRELWRRAGMPDRPGDRRPAVLDQELRRWLDLQHFASFTAFAQQVYEWLGRPRKQSTIRGQDSWHGLKKKRKG